MAKTYTLFNVTSIYLRSSYSVKPRGTGSWCKMVGEVRSTEKKTKTYFGSLRQDRRDRKTGKKT